MNKKPIVSMLVFILCTTLFASEVTFSGGYSKVSLKENNKTVTLSEGAVVDTGDFHITANEVQLYGENYRYVKCTGDVVVVENSSNMTLSCVSLTYDREKSVLISDGWIKVDDPENEAKLSGAWLEYDFNNSTMKLQIKAMIVKNTENGVLTCKSDMVEFNSEEMTLSLKGKSNVIWGDDEYSANIIMVDINSEEIVLYDSISGEIHG